MICRRCAFHLVNNGSWQMDKAGVQGPRGHQPLHLDNDNASRVVSRHCLAHFSQPLNSDAIAIGTLWQYTHPAAGQYYITL